MKHKVYFGIAIRIVLLVFVGSMITFVTPALRDWFGDTLKREPDNGIDCMYTWGARHCWYFFGMCLLFCLTIINFIISVANLVNKHYDTKNW